MIVTLDANFGLVRKQSSGTSLVEPLHGTRMFVAENNVQKYLLSHPDNNKPHEVNHSCRILYYKLKLIETHLSLPITIYIFPYPQDCSNFKAGNMLRSQKKREKA